MKNFNFESEKGGRPDVRKENGENLKIKGGAEISETETEDDELMRLESEKKWKEKTNNAFISEENLIDPESENIEDIIAEKIDNKENLEKKSTSDFKQIVSENRNWVPWEIKKIKKEHSLPSEKWQKLPYKEKVKHRKEMQKKIENLYIKKKKTIIKKKPELEDAA